MIDLQELKIFTPLDILQYEAYGDLGKKDLPLARDAHLLVDSLGETYADSLTFVGAEWHKPWRERWCVWRTDHDTRLDIRVCWTNGGKFRAIWTGKRYVCLSDPATMHFQNDAWENYDASADTQFPTEGSSGDSQRKTDLQILTRATHHAHNWQLVYMRFARAKSISKWINENNETAYVQLARMIGEGVFRCVAFRQHFYAGNPHQLDKGSKVT